MCCPVMHLHMLPSMRRICCKIIFRYIALNEIPTGEPYILLGDFNAQVGSRSASGDQWSDVCGPRGFGSMKDARKEFSAILATNLATLCNTSQNSGSASIM